MKKWILHIMFVGVLGMLAASCSQEADDPTQTADSRTAQVVFTIALDSPSAGSRATWGDDYASAIGTEFDNRINPDQFFVKLTLGGTTYDVKNIAYWQTGEQNVYEFVGDVNVNIDGTTEYTGAKIQVYANMNPDNDTFTTDYRNEGYPGTGVAYIPMWGVQTVDLSLTPGTRTELAEPIYLLRAMAKVEVIMAAKDCKIGAIKLNGYNPEGYCLPAGAETVANTKDLHYDNEDKSCFNPKTDASSDLDFNSENDMFYIYLPEYQNVGEDGKKLASAAQMTVQIGSETYTLEFKMYSDGTPFDIVRNHCYRYTITGVSKETDIELVYDVVDATSKTIEVPSFE